MPYIAITTYPKDQATKIAMAEAMSKALIDFLGCPEEAVTVSIEEVPKEDWPSQVKEKVIDPNMDKMLIVSGKRLYTE